MNNREWQIGDRCIFLGQYGTITGFRYNRQYERNLPIFQQDKHPQYFGFALSEDLHPIPQGQMELFGAISQPSPEPPDPDDYPTINTFIKAWEQWERDHQQVEVEYTTRLPQRYQYRSRRTAKPKLRRSLTTIKIENYVYPK